MMRHDSVLRRALILLSTGVTLVSLTFGATTGALHLLANVLPTYGLGIVATPAASNLNLIPNGTSTIAIVTEFSNNPTGYRIMVSSLNGGELVGPRGSASIGYRIRYDGRGYGGETLSRPLPPPRSPLTHTVKTATTSTPPDGKPVGIDMTLDSFAAGLVTAGVYTDMLAIEIAAP